MGACPGCPLDSSCAPKLHPCDQWPCSVLLRHVLVLSFQNTGLRMEEKKSLRQICNCLEIPGAGSGGFGV